MIAPNLTKQLFLNPSNCTPSALRALQSSIQDVERRIDAGTKPSEMLDLLAMLFPQREAMKITSDNIAVIHINGALAQGLTDLEKLMGVTDLADLRAELIEANDISDAVLIHGNSPGGTVTGGIETAEIVEEIARNKPVYVHTEEGFFSLGYKITCAATQLWGTRSSSWGSIGTIIDWFDTFDAWAQQGVYHAPIVSEGSDLKATGHGFRLSDTEREFLQDSVTKSGNQFKAWVLQHRSIPNPQDTFRGQWFDAPEAMQRGLIDVIGSAQDCYDSLLGTLTN
jgi:ClpP class serine protease